MANKVEKVDVTYILHVRAKSRGGMAGEMIEIAITSLVSAFRTFHPNWIVTIEKKENFNGK